MQDQNQQNNNSQTQAQDDFYNDVDSLNVSADEMRVMAALTQAEADAAERAGETVKEMEELVKEEQSQE